MRDIEKLTKNMKNNEKTLKSIEQTIKKIIALFQKYEDIITYDIKQGIMNLKNINNSYKNK